MFRYLPAVLGVMLIVGLTITQSIMSDRFSKTNISAEQQALLLKNVPINFNDWRGEDMDIDPTIRQTAGAIGAVSRTYRNVRTNEVVELWLIVGHAREISHHTPNICYQASGFEKRASENSLYPMVFPSQPEAPFWTNTFFQEDVKGRRLRRVFWSWYNAEEDSNQGKVIWEAPTNPRRRFGNTRALYKMYFTSEMRDQMETTEQSACLRFAREFMPIVNNALAQVYAEKSGDLTGNAPDAPPVDTTPLPIEAPAAVEPTASAAGDAAPAPTYDVAVPSATSTEPAPEAISPK